MARIKTISEEEAHGIRRALVWQARRRWGFVPGILKILMPDLRVGRRVGQLYDHLVLRKGSPLSRVQREMVAVVVNGHIGGAP